MSKFLYRKYVAMGDSLTEGLGDDNFETDRIGKGWADRLAGLLALEALEHGEEFHYANLAVRGNASLEILTAQLEDALRLQPDLVTIMTGANDLMGKDTGKSAIRTLLRGAITRLHDAGIQVVLLDIVRPTHSPLFRPLAYKSDRMSALLASIATEYGVPVISLNSEVDFGSLDYWCSDMAHFSALGHTSIANRVADELGLQTRLVLPQRAFKRFRTPWEIAIWLVRDVAPFFKRRILGQSSGDGLDPKHFDYECLVAPLAKTQSGVRSAA